MNATCCPTDAMIGFAAGCAFRPAYVCCNDAGLLWARECDICNRLASGFMTETGFFTMLPFDFVELVLLPASSPFVYNATMRGTRKRIQLN